MTAVKQYLFEDSRPFASCHASTLVALADGSILAAWFGGTDEGESDVDIWCSRRMDGHWSAPERIAGEPGIAHWNPVLFQGDNGILYLYYKVGHTIPRWYTRVIESRDEGASWGEPYALVEGDEGGRGPVRNKPIISQNGTWLAPASLESEVWDAFVDISRDQGQSWTMSEIVPLNREGLRGKGVIQPAMWESEAGQIHMLLRSTAGSIYRSDSADTGATWSEAYATDLPNNNSGIDLVKLGEGKLALVHNPISDSRLRTPLVVSLSEDDGATWREWFVLENEPGEYSYPAIIKRDGKLLITYTWKRERIVFWEIDCR
ncbi:sialidase family protein [Paenibacillus spongiae]|uniref:Exo-alpha-sialidase n=1 Tax=Paenibacillus spongiae TaxID=2909671 RepID=A0ABY5S2H3_9BACL|nr:sialidase family protein [Paenibacillus spongiae]UVI27770.1 exo-alpha-sialidase [Paenibacillus spongiae]